MPKRRRPRESRLAQFMKIKCTLCGYLFKDNEQVIDLNVMLKHNELEHDGAQIQFSLVWTGPPALEQKYLKERDSRRPFGLQRGRFYPPPTTVSRRSSDGPEDTPEQTATVTEEHQGH